MSNKSLFGLIVLLAAVIVGWNSFFVVDQTQRALPALESVPRFSRDL